MEPKDETQNTEIQGEAALAGLMERARVLKGAGRPHIDEATLAALVDMRHAGAAAFEPSLMNELVEVLTSLRLMDSRTMPNAPVPEVLRHVVANTLKKREHTPSIVVRLSRTGLSLVKSTLAGLELAPQTAVAVRSAAGAALTPRLEMTQVLGNGLALEYQVMQESDAEMMLVIRFRGRPEGAYRVDLREEERLIASQMVRRGSDSVSFSRIGEGGYQVDIAGPANHTFGLYVAAGD